MKGAMSELLQAELGKGRRALSVLARDFASCQLRRFTAMILHLRRTRRGKPLTIFVAAGAGVVALLLVMVVVGRFATGHNESANHAKPVAGTFAPTPTQ